MTNSPVIKIGFLVSYDYEFIRTSLPLVYESADLIVLAKDLLCRTWSGNTFEFSSNFFDWVKNIDKLGKVKIYEDNFYDPELSAADNDTRERRMLAEYMGEGGWHIQIDSDEYFINFPSFVSFLKERQFLLKNPAKNPVEVCARPLTLFKKIGDGYLWVFDTDEYFPVATNFPDYINSRGTRGIRLLTDDYFVHHSWARTEDEMWMKLSNWTHRNDFNTKSYYDLWKALDSSNYKYLYDFHPMLKGYWKRLQYIKASGIDEAISEFKKIKIDVGSGMVKKIKNTYWVKKLFYKYKNR